MFKANNLLQHTVTMARRRNLFQPLVVLGVAVCILLAAAVILPVCFRGGISPRSSLYQQPLSVEVRSTSKLSPDPAGQSVCIRSDQSNDWPGCSCSSLNIPVFALRPKLLIIVTETHNRKERLESKHVADNLSRYCAKHGYMFKLHHFQTDESLGLYGTRWKVLLSYWGVADWLLHVDSDTVAANLSNSMDRFLAGPHHVMLTYRGNKEITAAAVGVRSTEFGRCFIERWLALIAAQKQLHKTRNQDNGALVLLLAEFLDPKLAVRCNSRIGAGTPKDYWEFMECWEVIYSRFAQIAEDHNQPVRLYPPLGGFWREHSGSDQRAVVARSCHDDAEKEVMMFRKCWSTDIFVSGWKNIGVNMWPVLGSNASKANCSFNAVEQELPFAKKCCLVEYPGCYAANGTNMCRQQPACVDPQAGQHMLYRAQIGFGICRLGHPDPSFRLSPIVPMCV